MTTSRSSCPGSGIAAAFAAILVATAVAPVRAEEPLRRAGAVTFTVDHAKKTITVTARLAFYNLNCGPGMSCDVPAADIARIVKAIETMWNTGQRVKCYRFIVKVDAHRVGSQQQAGQDEVDVGLDYRPTPGVAITRALERTDNDPLSDSPDARVTPGRDTRDPTRWPSKTYDQTYAHEFGHIIGLDDNYDRNNSKVLHPGASEDLMFRKQGYVTQEMVKRVVQRSGTINLKDLECGWTVKYGAFEGTKCDGVGGDWITRADEVLGGVTRLVVWTVTIDPSTLGGSYAYDLRIGPPATTHSTASGKARIVKNTDGSIAMTVDDAPTGVTIGGRTTMLKLQGGTFIWQPAIDGVCK